MWTRSKNCSSRDDLYDRESFSFTQKQYSFYFCSLRTSWSGAIAGCIDSSSSKRICLQRWGTHVLEATTHEQPNLLIMSRELSGSILSSPACLKSHFRVLTHSPNQTLTSDVIPFMHVPLSGVTTNAVTARFQKRTKGGGRMCVWVCVRMRGCGSMCWRV